VKEDLHDRMKQIRNESLDRESLLAQNENSKLNLLKKKTESIKKKYEKMKKEKKRV
jgi:hypothetical protein